MKVITDHTAIKAILDSPNLSGRHARWWTRVFGQAIELSIIHGAGKENIVADALSRGPNGKPPTKGIREDEVQVAVFCSSTVDVSLQSLVPHDDLIFVIEVTHRTEKDPLLRLLINYLQKGKFSEDIKQSKGCFLLYHG